MKFFKSFWIYCNLLSSIVLGGCTGLQTNPYSISSSQKDFYSEYCRTGKQIKQFKISALYFLPALEAGLPVDKANQKNKQLNDHKNELLKNLFYLLGDSSMSEKINNQGDEPSWYLLTAETEKDVLEKIKSENASTKYRLFSFIVKIQNQNKVIVYQSNMNSRRMNYNPGYSTDLSTLFDQYTLLTPKSVIEDITGSEFDSNYLYSSIILNENGDVDIAKAIDQRDRLWKAYVRKFTVVKEVVEDNSQKSVAELALDLNTFCKYGRHISDLQSQ